MKCLAGIHSVFWAGILFLSFQFQYGHGHSERPVLLFVSLWVLGFVLLLVTGWRLTHKSWCWKKILLFGLLFRGMMIFSNPILEDDFYRYLWDGAVINEGVNPFKYSPDEIKRVRDGGEVVVEELRQRLTTQDIPYDQEPEELISEMKALAELGKQLHNAELYYSESWTYSSKVNVLDRVNHPEVPTIYPPLTQGVFAFASWLSPGSLWTLRFVFVCFEVLTLLMGIKILKALKKDPAWIIWYAWNPLVIKEFVNSPHLDVLMVSFLAVTLYFWVKTDYLKTFIFLALAILAKYFVAPFALLFMLWGKRHTYRPAVLALLLVMLGFVMFASAGSRQFQGLKTMSITGWQQNSVVAKCLEVPISKTISAVGLEPSVQEVAYTPYYIFDEMANYHSISLEDKWLRRMLSLFILVFMSVCVWKSFNESDPSCHIRWLALLLTGIFLLSPVANPWYAGVLMFFLPFVTNRFFLVILGTVLSFYYLHFYFEYNYPDSEATDKFRRIVLIEGVVLACAFYVQPFVNKYFSLGRTHGGH